MNPGGLVPSGALILWAPFALVLFFVMKPDRAALITILGGLLFLPEIAELKVPLLPAFTKQTIPYFAVLLGFTLRQPGRVWRAPQERWVLLVTLVMILGGIGMAITNPDPLTYGTWRKVYIPGMQMKDGILVALTTIFNVGIPFFLGTVLVRELSDLEVILGTFVKAALIYSLFALVELRFSPQWHRWIYGYGQHSFAQTIRFGGYRPMVFMDHGLAVALFFCVAVLAAIIRLRIQARGMYGMSAKTVALYLAIILVLCKSTGAIVYAALGILLFFMTSESVQRRVAVALAVVVLLYPSARGSGLIPTDSILSLAADVSGADRQQSLAFRFTNEEILLKKARERQVFGWGTWGRSWVYGDDGRSSTTADGDWILALGITGFVGFLAKFSLLTIPIALAAWRARNVPPGTDRTMVVGLSLIVALASFDLIPNGLFSNYPYFLAGALLTASALLVRRPRMQT